MSILGGRIIYLIFGYIFLWIKYRNKEKIKESLIKNYENSYSVAGFMVIWKPIGFLFICCIIALFIATIIGIFRFGIKD